MHRRAPALSDDVRSGLPKGIEKVLFRLLQKEPDNRPQDAAEVVEQLELFLPEKSFAGLGDIAVVAKSSRTIPSSGSVDTQRDATSASPGAKHDTLPSAQSTPVPASKDNAEEKRAARKDTVALIDEAASGRELSTGLSLLIIAVLMVVSGLTTYAWRASQDGAETEADSTETSAAETSEAE